MRYVYIVGDYPEYAQMFVDNGWGVVDFLRQADLVQFCGGEDVNPSLYGETVHHTTYYSEERDRREKEIFELAFNGSIPIAGICRGGQFVHVMCGGKLWQNVNNHGVRHGHHAYWVDEEECPVLVSSTHHQMMRDGVGEVLMVAHQTTFKEGMGEPETGSDRDKDVEVVYHEAMNALCFQPHPEFYNPDHPCQELYFSMIEEYLFDDTQ